METVLILFWFPLSPKKTLDKLGEILNVSLGKKELPIFEHFLDKHHNILKLGIKKVVLYTDNDINEYMRNKVYQYRQMGIPVEYRKYGLDKSQLTGIFISGKRRSGKDTVARLIKNALESKYTKFNGKYHIIIKPFADELKKEFFVLFPECVELNKGLYRKRLIEYGENKKIEHGDYYWFKRWRESFKPEDFRDKNTIIIVPDLRFNAELYCISREKRLYKSDFTLLIRVNSKISNRKKRGLIQSDIDSSPSEIELDNSQLFDIIINNDGTIEDLKKQILNKITPLF